MGVTKVILPIAYGLKTIPESILATIILAAVSLTHIIELSNPLAVFVNIRTRTKKYRVLMFLSFHHFFRGNNRPAR